MNAILKKCLAYLFLGIMIAVMYFPMLLLIVFSFTPTKSFGDWQGFNPLLYIRLFQNEAIMEAVRNSLIIALSSAVLATVIGTVTAIGIHYMGRRARSAVNSMNQITVINSEIVTAVAFMMFFLSVSAVLNAIGGKMDGGNSKIFGFATLIISHTMITIPFVILSVSPRLTQLNPNLYEAGLDLGASPVGALFKVLVPQLIPSMISGFVMAFTLSLDDFVITIFNNGGVQTISTLIYNEAKHGVSAEFRALSTIIFVTVLAILIGINIYTKRKAVKTKTAVDL